MNRRAFLQTLLGSVAALAVLPSERALAAFAPNDPTPFMDGYWAVLHEARKILLARCEASGWAIDPTRIMDINPRFGDRFPDGTQLTDMLGVDASLFPVTPDSRLIEPAMFSLAQEVSRRGLDTFAPLLLPHAMEFAGISGPLRFVVGFDPYHERMMARFDIAGGSSAAARPKLAQQARVRERARQQQLARSIRVRLSQPLRVLPLPI